MGDNVLALPAPTLILWPEEQSEETLWYFVALIRSLMNLCWKRMLLPFQTEMQKK